MRMRFVAAAAVFALLSMFDDGCCVVLLVVDLCYCNKC